MYFGAIVVLVPIFMHHVNMCSAAVQHASALLTLSGCRAEALLPWKQSGSGACRRVSDILTAVTSSKVKYEIDSDL